MGGVVGGIIGGPAGAVFGWIVSSVPGMIVDYFNTNAITYHITIMNTSKYWLYFNGNSNDDVYDYYSTTSILVAEFLGRPNGEKDGTRW